MAIKKVKTICDGQASIEHHVISAVPVIQNMDGAQDVSVTVYEYKEKASRTAGLVPLSSSSYVVSVSKAEIIQAQADVLELIYSKLAALPEFVGCEENV